MRDIEVEESKMGQSEGRGFHGVFPTWLGKLPTPEGQPFVVAYEHGTLSVEMYAPRDRDTRHRTAGTRYTWSCKARAIS